MVRTMMLAPAAIQRNTDPTKGVIAAVFLLFLSPWFSRPQNIGDSSRPRHRQFVKQCPEFETMRQGDAVGRSMTAQNRATCCTVGGHRPAKESYKLLIGDIDYADTERLAA